MLLTPLERMVPGSENEEAYEDVAALHIVQASKPGRFDTA